MAAPLALLMAIAQAGPSPEPPLDLGYSAESCEPGSEGEVVVCGERGRDPYRIDETVLDAMREKERAENPPRPPERVADSDPCRTGPNGCPGEGAMPIMAIALTAAEMVVKAIEGEDWREPLRTGPTDYERYQEAKKKREQARPRVRIGISARN